MEEYVMARVYFLQSKSDCPQKKLATLDHLVTAKFC